MRYLIKMKQIVKSYLLNKTRKEQGKGKKEHRWKLDYQMKDTLIPDPPPSPHSINNNNNNNNTNYINNANNINNINRITKQEREPLLVVTRSPRQEEGCCVVS